MVLTSPNSEDPLDTLQSIRTEGEALVLSISIPPLDASDQHVATEYQEVQPR